MKKTIAILGLIVLLGSLAGCRGIPDSKQIIIVNDSDHTIDIVCIHLIVVDEDARDQINSLGDKTIPPDGEMAFHISPYCDSVYINIDDTGDCNASAEFTFDYLVKGVNEDIKVYYSITGTGLEATGTIDLEGSNVTEWS
ncbi:MAG: hypothetical protein AB9828_11395 [Sphaerochaetaceae bacterium]